MLAESIVSAQGPVRELERMTRMTNDTQLGQPPVAKKQTPSTGNGLDLPHQALTVILTLHGGSAIAGAVTS